MTSRLLRGAVLSQPVAPGTVLFHDDFDGPAGSPPDPSSWTPDVGRGYYNLDGSFEFGWGNSELQWHSADSLQLDGAGNLVVSCRRGTPPDGADVDANHHFIAGRMHSEGKRAFVPPVRIEARIKWPLVNGAHLAWWTMGGPINHWPHAGEIDLCEVFGAADSVQATVWGPLGTEDPDSLLDTQNANYAAHNAALPGAVSVPADYILHRTDVLPDSITTYFNGVQWQQVTRADQLAAGTGWPYDRTAQYLLFNFAMLGLPDVGFTEAEALIDYVTVTQL